MRERIKIKTNHQFRPILHWHDLTDSEQNDLRGLYDTIEDSTFFRYRGHVYDLGDCMRTQENGELSAWHGYFGESFFSSVLVKYSDDCESVKVGLALS